MSQLTMVNILVIFDAKIRVENHRLAKLQELKRGLMQTLLSGKVRVKVDEDAEVVV